MLDSIKNFIYEHFFAPGYDVVNTVTYGLILGLSVFGVLKLINILKIRINFKFALSLIPFIFFGATTRVLTDAGFFGAYSTSMHIHPLMPLYWVVAPGIFFTMFALTFISLILGILIEKITKSKIKYYIPFCVIGSFFALHNLFFIINKLIEDNFKNIDSFLVFSFFFLLSILFLFFITRFFETFSFLKNEKNHLIVSAHLFDASATFTGVQFFGYTEKHVLPNFLIQQTGAWIMFPLKLCVVITVIYLIDKTIEDETIRRLIKIVILILGLGPGIRDVGRMIIGV